MIIEMKERTQVCVRATSPPHPQSKVAEAACGGVMKSLKKALDPTQVGSEADRKSTRLNSSHGYISYAVFCLKKKKNTHIVSTLSCASFLAMNSSLIAALHRAFPQSCSHPYATPSLLSISAISVARVIPLHCS